MVKPQTALISLQNNRESHRQSLCCCSVTQSCLTLCDPMDSSTAGFPVLHCLLEFAQTDVHWVNDAVQPSHPLLPLHFLPWIFPSIRVFPNRSALHIRWPKDWSFSFRISPSNEHSGLISFRIDWFDLLAVQGTLKHLLQHHSLKAFILWCSALMVQFSLTSVHDYRKNHSFNCTHLCLLWSPQSKAFT